MKKTKPQLDRKYKSGDVREDGYIFQSYRLRDGRWQEDWISPQRLAAKRARRNSIQHNFPRPKDWSGNLKRGDKRPNTPEYSNLQDGKIFHRYHRNGSATYEIWLCPTKYNELVNAEKGRPVMKPKDYRAWEKKPNTNHILSQYKVNDPELITNKQLLNDARALVANAMKQGLIRKAA